MSAARIISTTLLMALCIIAGSGSVLAELSTDSTESLALRKIMQDMGKNMQAITDGISREDWALVEQNAVLLADHPQPPLGEKIRILMFAGSHLSRFKAYDSKTHEAAKGLAEVATNEDSYGVIQAFAELQKTCLDCHQTFRQTFLQHFYGAH